MLGMYMVLENYLGMVSDYPEAYEGAPAFNFVKQVPTTWDDTKVLDGTPGEFVVIAWRKGGQWFVEASPMKRKEPFKFHYPFGKKAAIA
jgi:alpha-glucosidase